MTIGLVILGIVAVMLFFGAAEKYFDRLGLTSWLTFLLVLALIIGAVMPEINAGMLTITVGGFIVPFVVLAVVFALTFRSGNFFRPLVSVLVVAMTAVAFRLIVGVGSAAQVLVCSLLTGFIGGALAFLTAGSRLGTIAGAMGGCIIGDAVSAGLLRAFFDVENFVLGGFGIFDSIVISAAFGLLALETVAFVKRKADDRRSASLALNAEAAEDVDITADESEITEEEDDVR